MDRRIQLGIRDWVLDRTSPVERKPRKSVAFREHRNLLGSVSRAMENSNVWYLSYIVEVQSLRKSPKKICAQDFRRQFVF